MTYRVEYDLIQGTVTLYSDGELVESRSDVLGGTPHWSDVWALLEEYDPRIGNCHPHKDSVQYYKVSMTSWQKFEILEKMT